MPKIDLNKLGPLERLVGTWEGKKGKDVSPSDDRGTDRNNYKERIVFTPILPQDNHEQWLYGLRYHLQAIKEGEKHPFHDQVGYWHWDPKAKQVMQSLTIPRGMTTFAGGKATASSRSFTVKAKLGSRTFGICSNPFLDREFRTLSFENRMTLGRDGSLSYDQTTVIRMKGRGKLFKHRDRNTLRKIQR
jgi:hypothetical protein